MTGAIVQKEFQKRRYVYSKTLRSTQCPSTRDAEEMTSVDLLLTTPSAVDLEPPQYADAHRVLVKEVHDPAPRVSQPFGPWSAV